MSKDIKDMIEGIESHEKQLAELRNQNDRLREMIEKQKGVIRDQETIIEEQKVKIARMYDIPEDVLELKELIGSRIQEIRNKKGITQDQLSEKVGISAKYLSSIERGKENPTLNTILKLAQSLDVKPDHFFIHLEIEDPAKRKSMINEILDEADEDQLKLIYKVLSAMMI